MSEINDEVPAIHMDPSLFARLFFGAVAAICYFIILYVFMPQTRLTGAAMVALTVPTALYFLKTQAFNMRLAFYPDRAVFTAFRLREEILAADIEKVFYKGYLKLLLSGPTYDPGESNWRAGSPHLVFVMKSGRQIPVQIDPSNEKLALKYTRDMLRGAGHDIPEGQTDDSDVAG